MMPRLDRDEIVGICEHQQLRSRPQHETKVMIVGTFLLPYAGKRAFFSVKVSVDMFHVSDSDSIKHKVFQERLLTRLY